MWYKLESLGLNGKILKAVKSLYSDVKCCVQLNGTKSDWFSVSSGLKQGCLLSPILFNLYINDLTTRINGLGLRIDIGTGEKVGILLYADDIVFVAGSEADLQKMLD